MVRYVQNAAIVVLFVLGCGLAFSSCSNSILRDGSQPPCGITALFGISAAIAALCAWSSSMNSSRHERYGVFLDVVALFGVYGAAKLTLLTNTFFALGPTGEPNFQIQTVLIAAFLCVSGLCLVWRFLLNCGLQPVTITSPSTMFLVIPIASALLLVRLNWIFAEDRIVLGDGREIVLRTRGFPLLSQQEVYARRAPEATLTEKKPESEIMLPDGVVFDINSSSVLKVTLPGRRPIEIKPDQDGIFVCPDFTRVRVHASRFVVELYRQTPIMIEKNAAEAAFSNGQTRVFKMASFITNIFVDGLLFLAFLLNALSRNRGITKRRKPGNLSSARTGTLEAAQPTSH